MEFKNRLNGELFYCNDPRLTQQIDGIDYLLVSRPGQNRQFLMRRDVLDKVPTVKKVKDKKVQV